MDARSVLNTEEIISEKAVVYLIYKVLDDGTHITLLCNIGIRIVDDDICFATPNHDPHPPATYYSLMHGQPGNT